METIVTEKKCNKCGGIYPVSHFRKGHRICRECQNKRQWQYYATHKKEYIGYIQKYVSANRDAISKRRRRYRENNKEEISRRKHAFYIANKSKINEQKRKYNAINKAEISVRRHEHYLANKSEIYKKMYENRKAHPEISLNAKRRRRARKIKAGGDFTQKEFKALCDKTGNICLCCRQFKKLESDHIVPISKGGRNNIENIQPLCRNCNARKSDKTIDYRH